MVTETVGKWEQEMSEVSKMNGEQVEHMKLSWMLPRQKKMLDDLACLSSIRLAVSHYCKKSEDYRLTR